MSLDEIAFFSQLIYQIDGGVGVIEIGDETKQLSAILAHTTICWGKGYIKIDIINRIFFCNNFEYKKFPLLDYLKPIVNNDLKYKESLNTKSWSFNILGATYAHEINNNNKNLETPVKNIIHADVEKLKLIRRHNYANKKKVRRHRHRKVIGSKVVIDMSKLRSDQKKHECKYRKSCYTTGELNLNIFYKDPIQKESSEIIPLTVDQLKLICKYRKSCYDNAGIPKEQKIFLEDNDDDKKIGLFTKGGKQVIKATKKNKKTLKNIAAKTLRNAQKKIASKVEKLEENPNYAFEKYLEENEEINKKKQNCKYRKSCYETGIVPFETDKSESIEETIQKYWNWIEEKLNFDVNFNIVKEEIPFDDLNDEDKKLRCLYRKSCYKTGIKPIISDKIFSPPANIEVTIDPIINHNEENKKLACKYRKSCYESGIIPQFSTNVPEVKEKVVPLNEDDFKVYCKFRKSCYAKEAKLEKDENIENNDIEKVKDTNIEEETKEEKEVIEDKETINVEEEIVEVQKDVKNKEKKQKKIKKINTQEVPAEIISDEIKPLSKKKDSKKENTVDDKQPKGKKSKKNKKDQTIDKESISVEASELKEALKKTKVDEVNEKESDNVEPSKSKETSKKTKKTKNKKEGKIVNENVEEIKNVKESPTNVENSKEKKVTEKTNTHETSQTDESKKPKKIKQKKEPEISESQEKKNDKKEWYKNMDFDKYINYAYDIAKVIQNIDYVSYFKIQEKLPKEHIEHNFDPEEEAKKIKCHYRKSCYETGEIPNITHHVFETSPIKLNTDNLIVNMELENKKIACKYRKSCYENGEIPVITYETKIFEPTLKTEIPDDEENFKIFCKYRKSCYETKIPPNLTEIEEEIYIPLDEYDMKTRCKFRKSCYKKIDEDESTKNEEVKQTNKEIKVKKSKKSNLDDNMIEKSVKDSKKHVIIDKTNGTKSISDDEIKIANNKIDKVLQIKEDVKSSTNKPISCNPFRISCKQLLGIPIPEKPPRAKNGKKLCRKKKTPTS
ncbi:Hypothetical protein SRAE_1000280700 [Strongyloides ratti]|uniref:Uncharacterized protein n=1 Tax=Strongyloides ratti TaxID=34506 RepID=A0A090L8T6_STRRB|nr:Hypothetical protein SRAE_1000280700 [Strongyloides ratti]CEF64553.1 Hypothetical protein SRAE_1000280700 [Strongyloides ratti]